MAACTPAIKANIDTSEKFYAWLKSQRAIADPILSKGGGLSPADQTVLINVQKELQGHSNCLEQVNNYIGPMNTENAELRSSNAALQAQLKADTQTLQIAQDRLLLVRHPELSTSYYEGILSLGRPMRHYTVPVLVGISAFLFCMAFLLFLNLIRFDLRVILWIPEKIFKSTYEPFKHPFYMLLVVCIGLLIYTIYTVTK